MTLPQSFDAQEDDLGVPRPDASIARAREVVTGLGELTEELEDAFGEETPDETPDLIDDAEDEAEIARYVARATSGSGRESVSALSSLSQQMQPYPVLSVEEQHAALAAYNAGLAARAQLAAGTAGRKRRQLEETARRGESAHAQLVGSMFRLVLVIARENAAQRYGRERSLDMLSDLVAEANVAVVEAVDSYDPAKCPAFNTYAGRVVRDRVRMCLSKTSSVGLAPSWLRLKRLATVLSPEVAARLGRTPNTAEMQEALHVVCLKWAKDRLTDAQRMLPEEEQLALMEAKLRKQGMLGAIERYEEVMIATQQVASLDSPVGDEGGARLADMLPGVGGSSEFEAVELDELRRDLMAALSALPERDREIVLYRFGFMDGEQWTYARLAPRYKVSAERIRQIERNVLTKLRGPGFGALGAHLPGRAA